MYPNTLKIHMVCVTYIQEIYFFQHSFSYFIYLLYFVFKKTEIRVKPNKKKIMGLSFSVKLHLYLTGNTLIHYGYYFFYLYINEVELFISHS